MKTLLIAINAKYIHTSLSVLSLAAAARREGLELEVKEFTINQHEALLLREIYLQSPDLLGISCYIWNIAIVQRLLPTLRKLLPNCVIALGGPEVSYGGKELFDKLPCNLILQGEGEISFPQLIKAVENGTALEDIASALYNGEFCTPSVKEPAPIDMDTLPFPYNEAVELENKIAYYETSRGCPFKCGYCLSGGKGGVRYRSLPLVFKELSWFLSHRLRQVKLVDRTFNCDEKRALDIWKYLSLNDNGITNFHFEIAAELLTEEQLSFLATVRAGQFQFEIGVQSTHPETLKEINRITITQKLTPIIKRLKEAGRIHLHLDLIAGLPLESYVDFKSSYNYVYSLNPDQLQLGFLKLLKGSIIHDKRDSLGISFNTEPPYEVLFTTQLPYSDLLRLKLIEEVTERYYNAGRFSKALEYLVSMFDSPFACYEALGDFYGDKGYLTQPHSKLEDYEILFAFFSSLLDIKTKSETEIESENKRFKYLCLYDFCLHEKPRRFPAFMSSTFTSIYKTLLDGLKNTKARSSLFPEYQEHDTASLLRLTHAEKFPFDPCAPEVTNSKAAIEQQETIILFNYRAKAGCSPLHWPYSILS